MKRAAQAALFYGRLFGVESEYTVPVRGWRLQSKMRYAGQKKAIE